MAAEEERTAVRTYVPTSQREEWREHAERLDMSESEFVRTMVQAGRRGFSLEDGTAVEPRSPDATPGGSGLEDRILDLLAREGPLDWDELVDGLVDDLEDRVDGALNDLQEENRVRYSGRNGGYEVVEDGR